MYPVLEVMTDLEQSKYQVRPYYSQLYGKGLKMHRTANGASVFMVALLRSGTSSQNGS
jgi:hypothetical protein